MYESNYDEEELGFHPVFNKPTEFTLIRGHIRDWHPFFYMKLWCEESITSKFKNSHIPVDVVADKDNPFIKVTEEEYYRVFKEFEIEHEMNRDKEEPVIIVEAKKEIKVREVKKPKVVKKKIVGRERDEIDEIMDMED